MDVREFVEAGYLQEVNRLFLHPRGLALEVKTSGPEGPDRLYELAGVWDARDDPEGIYFDRVDGHVRQERLDKVRRIEEDAVARQAARARTLGYVIQPQDQL